MGKALFCARRIQLFMRRIFVLYVLLGIGPVVNCTAPSKIRKKVERGDRVKLSKERDKIKFVDITF